jgi:hypothetical protein
MTVMALRSWRIVRARPRSYVLDIHLTTADSHRLAALTRGLAGQPSPHDQLAIIIGGIVFSRSAVLAPITNGQAVINPGYTGPDGLEAIQHHLR